MDTDKLADWRAWQQGEHADDELISLIQSLDAGSKTLSEVVIWRIGYNLCARNWWHLRIGVDALYDPHPSVRVDDCLRILSQLLPPYEVAFINHGAKKGYDLAVQEVRLDACDDDTSDWCYGWGCKTMALAFCAAFVNVAKQEGIHP